MVTAIILTILSAWKANGEVSPHFYYYLSGLIAGICATASIFI